MNLTCDLMFISNQLSTIVIFKDGEEFERYSKPLDFSDIDVKNVATLSIPLESLTELDEFVNRTHLILVKRVSTFAELPIWTLFYVDNTAYVRIAGLACVCKSNGMTRNFDPDQKVTITEDKLAWV